MTTPLTNGELIPWNVPFAEWDTISAWVITEKGSNAFAIVVASADSNNPKDSYPKYLIRFDKVLTLFLSDGPYGSSSMRIRDYPYPMNEEKMLNAYEWIGSPWLQSHQQSKIITGPRDKDGQMMCKSKYEANQLRHYLIEEGSNTIEVIILGEAKFERVDAKKFIDVKHEI